MAAAVAASLNRGRAGLVRQSIAAEAAVQLVVDGAVAPQLRCLAAGFSAGLAGASAKVSREAARSAAAEVVKDTAWNETRRQAPHQGLSWKGLPGGRGVRGRPGGRAGRWLS